MNDGFKDDDGVATSGASLAERSRRTDMFRVLLVCATVAFLGYLGYSLLAHRFGRFEQAAGDRWDDSLKIYRLVARFGDNKKDSIQVSGKVQCVSGAWNEVTLAFVFRGPNNVVQHREHYKMPAISEKTPTEAGICTEFNFSNTGFP